MIATPRTMAIATGLFYCVGSLPGLLLSWLPHVPGAHLGSIRLMSAAAALIGASILVAGAMLPAWSYHVLHLAGTPLISTAIWISGGGALAVSLATLYVLVPLHGFAFFRPHVAATYLAYACLPIGPLCWPLGVLPTPVVLTAGLVNLVAAGGVGWLVRSAERVELDAVTGLPNRRGFDRALEQALADARRVRGTFTVGCLDLDHFRRINETEGRTAGDEVLRAAGRQWSRMLPAAATVAHSGGGEFLVLLPGQDVEAAGHAIEGLRSTLPHLGTASAGLAEWQPEDTASLLLSRADASLYRAKRAGRNRIDPRVGLSVTVREMRQALQDDSFLVLFQPIVDLQTDVTVAAEALVRWDHPDRGLINPDDFIPLAEESGVIIELGRLILERACRAVRAAERSDRHLGKVTVNVAGRQLQHPGFADEVLDVLERTGLDPHRLILEVTESSLAAEERLAITALAELQRQGVRIAIDDFGTGYSSLSRLAHLPVDILKIDKAFVNSLEPGRAAPIIASITALAEALNLSTVAEGIENREQASILAEHGCHKGQGWLYGRPAEMEHLELPRLPSPGDDLHRRGSVLRA